MVAVLPRQLMTIILFAVAAAGVLVQLAVASAPAARASSSATSYRCGWCPRRSTASLLPPDAGALTGAACGYPGTVSSELADAGFHIAAVSAGLFRDGQACGACYQLRCMDPTSCAEEGVKIVVVADVPGTNRTGANGGGRFLLTKDALAAMTNRGAMPVNQDGDRASGLDDDAAVGVDFRRIPCVYGGKNLAVKVDEASVRSRGRLALRFLYQGGQTNIAAVEVAQAVTDGDNESAPSMTMWRYMTRRGGSPGVWRTSRAPAGPLRLRVVVTAGSGGKWLLSDGAVLAADWVAGGVHDTGLRVAEVSASTCGASSCNAGAGDEDGDEELR